MIGVVLLLVALGVSVVLVLVFAAAARARTQEREQLLIESGADEMEIEEARRHRPPLKGWLVCSAIALVVVTVAVGLVVKGCSAMGRTIQDGQDLQHCSQSVTMLAEWFGPYWDKNKKLPGAGQVPISSVECPAGNDFLYVGHRKMKIGGARLLVVELQPHPNGTRHALVVGEDFLAKRKTVAEVSGVKKNPGWGGWTPNAQYFRLRVISESEYEGIQRAIESPEAEDAK